MSVLHGLGQSLLHSFLSHFYKNTIIQLNLSWPAEQRDDNSQIQKLTNYVLVLPQHMNREKGTANNAYVRSYRKTSRKLSLIVETPLSGFYLLSDARWRSAFAEGKRKETICSLCSFSGGLHYREEEHKSGCNRILLIKMIMVMRLGSWLLYLIVIGGWKIIFWAINSSLRDH